MVAVVWCDNLVIGHDVIDAQHKCLIDLASVLVQSFEKKRSHLVAKEALDALDIYTGQHFRDEEKLIAEVNPNAWHAHRQMHASLELDMQSLRAQLIARMPYVGEHVTKWVTNCLIPHIQGADMEALKGVQPQP